MDIDVRIRKVKILRGDAKEAAYKAGATDDNDLVILRAYHTQVGTLYEAEKIIGDPVSYLMRGTSEETPAVFYCKSCGIPVAYVYINGEAFWAHQQPIDDCSSVIPVDKDGEYPSNDFFSFLATKSL